MQNYFHVDTDRYIMPGCEFIPGHSLLQEAVNNVFMHNHAHNLMLC